MSELKEILAEHTSWCQHKQGIVEADCPACAQERLVRWLEERKRNTYLPLEEPCEWIAFSLDDWQALCQKVLEKETEEQIAGRHGEPLRGYEGKR